MKIMKTVFLTIVVMVLTLFVSCENQEIKLDDSLEIEFNNKSVTLYKSDIDYSNLDISGRSLKNLENAGVTKATIETVILLNTMDSFSNSRVISDRLHDSGGSTFTREMETHCWYIHIALDFPYPAAMCETDGVESGPYYYVNGEWHGGGL